MDQQETWEALAKQWKNFRRKKISGVKEFAKDSDVILDLGCGSGRNFVEGKTMVCVDFSYNMLKFAKEFAEEKGITAFLVKADVSALPFKESVFNKVMAVSVLHISKKREQVVREIKRVLKTGGKTFIVVWNKKQPRFLLSSKNVKVPWVMEGKTYQRYYYLFDMEEITSLVKHSGLSVLGVSGSKDKAFNLFPKDIVVIAEKRGSPSGQWDQA